MKRKAAEARDVQKLKALTQNVKQNQAEPEAGSLHRDALRVTALMYTHQQNVLPPEKAAAPHFIKNPAKKLKDFNILF